MNKFIITIALVTANAVFSNTTYAAIRNIVLPAGTSVYVQTKLNLDSQTAGNIVPCEVYQDVMQGDVIAIQAGERALCKIEKAEARGFFGRPGSLALSISGTKAVDNQPIALTGNFAKSGTSRKGAAWGVGMLLFWPALLIPGGEAELPAGTVIETITAKSVSIIIN